MNLSINAPPPEAMVIRELLSPLNVTFTAPENAEVSIVYNEKIAESKSSVVIPSDSLSFKSWAKKSRLDYVMKPGNLIFVAATEHTALSITPKTRYCFDMPETSTFDDDTSTNMEPKEDIVVLKVDVVQEFNSLMDETLTPKQSKLHKLFTELPIPYGLAPQRVRDFFMKCDKGPQNLSLCDKLPMDALRFMLVNAIEEASDKVMEKKPVFSENYVCILTHDIESSQGLQRASVIKKVEEKYDVRSAWYVSSKRYKLDDDVIRELANQGEVGSHDTKHDGKLAHLSKDKLVQRVSDVRQTLGKIIQQPVEGFRAPILQHSPTLMQALSEAGYKYDTSIPSWDPKHPYTMKPHGVGTVFPLTFDGLTEIPLTLPQDHQLLHVLGLSPDQVLKTWAIMASVIRDLGGVCMFLVHPDYEIVKGNTELYEELVNAITYDPQATITVPSRVCTLMNE
ncbi:MAG: polysaccharide deacetylase family protein [Candidatus Bathyarchaeota archaeon]|nr:polysaccharide deacetylase family protein [Candidatus Bathyarchaeota archaeon]